MFEFTNSLDVGPQQTVDTNLHSYPRKRKSFKVDNYVESEMPQRGKLVTYFWQEGSIAF